jgi:tetratricopeptide (TPR) repeat protein
MPWRLANEATMKRGGRLTARAVIGAGCLAAGIAALLSLAAMHREGIGLWVWERLRVPGLALWLYPDAGLAMRIGNSYFSTETARAYDLTKARRYFARALAIDPAVPLAWHQVARIEFLQGHFADALDAINRQIALHGDRFIQPYYVRGLIHGYMRQFEQAEADLAKFLTWEPRSWAAHNDLAWVYFQMGRYADTERIASQGLRWNPDNPWLLNMLGVALLNLEARQEAQAVLTQALEETGALSVADWHRAYPGNHPDHAAKGIEEMHRVVEFNLGLVSGNS